MPDKEWLYPNLRENGYTYSVLENLHYIPHVHGSLECVYVLDGELCATIDEKTCYWCATSSRTPASSTP